MDVYLNYKYTGANNLDGDGQDMATTSIASIAEREVHRHRIALETTWAKSLTQDFALLSRRSSLCGISAVREFHNLWPMRSGHTSQEQILML